jgi:hypothetical protein
MLSMAVNVSIKKYVLLGLALFIKHRRVVSGVKHRNTRLMIRVLSCCHNCKLVFKGNNRLQVRWVAIKSIGFSWVNTSLIFKRWLS